MSLRPITLEGKFQTATLPFYGDISLGNMTQYKVGMFKTPNGRLFVGIEGLGAYTFQNWVHWTYVAEKLRMKFEGDAKNFADFLNNQLGHDLEFQDKPCQGEYDRKLLADVDRDENYL